MKLTRAELNRAIERAIDHSAMQPADADAIRKAVSGTDTVGRGNFGVDNGVCCPLGLAFGPAEAVAECDSGSPTGRSFGDFFIRFDQETAPGPTPEGEPAWWRTVIEVVE